MRTQKEIIEALLEVKERMTIVAQGKLDEELLNNMYYSKLRATLSALLFVLDVKDVIV